ncbi:MAG: hypothetical protein QOD06_1552 [Candidatus Binatota bacterium]|jgi:predicted nucleic acid-binding protein|nr:hypothetical protein [Candidatus Binatota bacterium]
MIHLDTSFLIGSLQPGSSEDARLRTWLRNHEPVGISTIAWTEFLCGPVDQEQQALAAGIVGQPEAFLVEDSERAAELFNAGGRRRGTLIDCMIAAVALRADAALATMDVDGFRRLGSAGLRIARS